MLFVSDTCAHCNNLKEELINKNYYEKFNINEYEISDFMQLYIEKSKEVNYKNGRVPLMIYSGEYYEGKNAIISYLEEDKVVIDNTEQISNNDLFKINEIVQDEKDKLQHRKILFSVLIIIITFLSFIIIQRVFQPPHRRKGRGRR